MKPARFSREAKADLRGIVAYTLRTWGADQAVVYRDGLSLFCDHLANYPMIGRLHHASRPGLFRMEWRRHVIFYKITPSGIRVTRILHDSMVPSLHEIG